MSVIINSAPGLCGPYEIESKPMTSPFSTLGASYKQLFIAEQQDNDVGVTDTAGVCYTFWYNVRGERDEGIIRETHFKIKRGKYNV